MKKCCVNCAFCLRTKDYGHNSTNRFIYGILDNEERKNALNNNFDFLKAEIKKRAEWKAQYNQILDNMKKGMYSEHLGGGRNVLELLTHESMHQGQYTLFSIFGMPQRPDAPDADYLSCWHNLWNFKDKKDDFSILNQKNDCLFFYPYNKKGNKSFEGCEKEREALLAKSRFITTNGLVILGIFVTIIIFAIQTWNNYQSNLQQEIVTAEENTQPILNPTIQNESSQLSESEKK